MSFFLISKKHLKLALALLSLKSFELNFLTELCQKQMRQSRNISNDHTYQQSNFQPQVPNSRAQWSAESIENAQ